MERFYLTEEREREQGALENRNHENRDIFVFNIVHKYHNIRFPDIGFMDRSHEI